MKKSICRREFLKSTAAFAGFIAVPRHVLGGAGVTAPSEKLNIACIGVGGMGGSDVRSVSTENLVALCDVDQKRAAGSFDAHPNARKYSDFRKMLDKEEKNIDAVTVSTPDNCHAVAAMAAMKRGKHVYCQKPLCHDIFEVRSLTLAARKYKVQTQMGIQIHAEEAVKRAVELVNAGTIGKIRRVDIFSNKNWGGGERPTDTPPVPEGLDWDLWIGPAPYRPYHPCYAPGNWRRWWDFGTGTLGDMGCHIIDPVWWAMDLQYPTSVEAEPGPFNDETYPTRTKVTWEFPARGDRPAMTLTWNDGANRPARPDDLEEGRNLPGQGGVYYGEKGTIVAPHMGTPAIVPMTKMKEIGYPVPTLERGTNHYQDWIRACKGGPKPSANFDYAGPLSEAILLGNIAAKVGRKLQWDGPNLRFTNSDEANTLLKRTYREGWAL